MRMKLTDEQYENFKANNIISRERLEAAAKSYNLPIERQMASMFIWENGKVSTNLEDVKIIKVDKAQRSKDLIVTIITDSLEDKMESELFLNKACVSVVQSGGCRLERFFI